MKILADFFRALANERRLTIWKRLHLCKSASVIELAEELGISETATTKHLKKMLQVGLIKQVRKGEYVLSSIRTS